MRRLISLYLALLSITGRAGAQAPVRPNGVPAPAAVVVRAVQGGPLLRILNSVQILKEGAVGPTFVRVLGTWGGSAGLDCDCLTTIVYVATNVDGEDLRLYGVGELLDPRVDSLVNHGGQPAAYVSYGLPDALRQVRLLIAGARVRAEDPRRAP